MRSRTVLAGQLSLFDLALPSQTSPAGPAASPAVPAASPPVAPAPLVPEPRAIRRRRYAQTVVADVRLRRAALLRERALQVIDEQAIDEHSCAVVEDDAPDSRAAVASDWVAAVGTLLDPIAELAPLTGALDLVAVDVDLSDRGEDWCRLEWTVTVTLRDAKALRDIALAARPASDPGSRSAIRRSVGEALRWAADPYAPLRHLPGIDWTPVTATVEHVPARAALDR